MHPQFHYAMKIQYDSNWKENKQYTSTEIEWYNYIENAKNNATAAKTAATIMYKLLTLVTVTFALLLFAVPNKKKLTIMGPRVVPKEFIPPAKFNLCEPVAGSPKAIANGWAAVCCKEKPSATIKNETSINGNEFALAEGIMANAPTMEMPNP